MLNILMETLKSYPNIDYLIRETATYRVESYNIRQQTEMWREVETVDISLTIYVVFEESDETGAERKYRGSYSTVIHPSTTRDELREIIEQGRFAAGFVKNEYYPLVQPSPAQILQAGELDLSKEITCLKAALYANDTHENGNLSYSEIYATRSRVRIINSLGVDVSYTTHRAFVETAVHWRKPCGSEIEISESYRFSLDTADGAAILRDRIMQLFNLAMQKAEATPTPNVEGINILLSGECLGTFFSYYQSRANAQMIYQNLSTFEVGGQVQGDNPDGDIDFVTLTIDPTLRGSASGSPYDADGLPLKAHTIIQRGKLCKYSGDTRFAHYLGISPTGGIGNMYVSGGTATMDDLRKQPYLELISFSDFQVNSITGDFGSEIRLGFYFDGKTVVPVTGGSISGNMAKVNNTFRMSKEERQYNNYLGPATVCFRGAVISGA